PQGGASYGLAARPPAHFSWLLDVPEITTTENKNQTEKPFTQNPLQNPYFPAWIVCIVLGLALTLITRQVLIGLKLNTHIHPAPLVYILILVIFTLTLWLAFFQN
ncbi:MAG TPA: YtcA family lipoprotein, partial [Verrucomicrobiae bacterium]|nr:YtcA family lipoprotein [Verrucomicrobiae bacterium]